MPFFPSYLRLTTVPWPPTLMTPAFSLFCKHARLAPSQSFCTCGSLRLECSPQLPPQAHSLTPFLSLLQRPQGDFFLLNEAFFFFFYLKLQPHTLYPICLLCFLKTFLSVSLTTILHITYSLFVDFPLLSTPTKL